MCHDFIHVRLDYKTHFSCWCYSGSLSSKNTLYFKVAAEKAPIRDPAVRAIRAAYNQAKSEFATALAPEKQKVISVFVIKCTAISDA